MTEFSIPLHTQLDVNWSRMTTLTNNLVVERFGDKDVGVAYQQLFTEVRHDRVINNNLLLGMRRAPASKERHHDREGGLVEHLLQMWDLWADVHHAIHQNGNFQDATIHSQLNDSNVWKGILHHDLNKIWRYKLVATEPWKVDYANDDDRATSLLGNTHKSMWFLNKYGIRLTLPLYNALICAEGGFAEHHTHSETILAKIIYILDELSANVVDRLKSSRFWDSKAGGLSEKETQD